MLIPWMLLIIVACLCLWIGLFGYTGYFADLTIGSIFVYEATVFIKTSVSEAKVLGFSSYRQFVIGTQVFVFPLKL